MGDFEEEFPGLGGDFGGHHDERTGVAQGEMERSEGRDGAFSGLAGGDDDDPGIVAAQDFGLLGVGGWAHVDCAGGCTGGTLA